MEDFDDIIMGRWLCCLGNTNMNAFDDCVVNNFKMLHLQECLFNFVSDSPNFSHRVCAIPLGCF